jgi:hypothetical protein
MILFENDNGLAMWKELTEGYGEKNQNDNLMKCNLWEQDGLAMYGKESRCKESQWDTEW